MRLKAVTATEFKEDIKNHFPLFVKSFKKINPKVEYYFGPYDKEKQRKKQRELEMIAEQEELERRKKELENKKKGKSPTKTGKKDALDS